MILSAPPPMPLFSLNDVSFHSAGMHILNAVSVDIAPGRVVGIIGPNGSGKSTLVRLLARQIAPTGGQIGFEGRPLDELKGRAFARRVGYLPQRTPETGNMTVRELVSMGRYPWHGALARKSLKDEMAIDEAMRVTGIEAFADRVFGSLSGGEAQRVWISMLVAQDSGCLLLDEPTSALDLARQYEIFRLISSLVRMRSMTVVAVIHDLNVAARFCDSLVALKEGRIVTLGEPRTVITTDVLHCLFDAEMDVLRHPRTDGLVVIPR